MDLLKVPPQRTGDVLPDRARTLRRQRVGRESAKSRQRVGRREPLALQQCRGRPIVLLHAQSMQQQQRQARF
jgi:hypothetical protein